MAAGGPAFVFGQYVSVEEVLGPEATGGASRDDELGELEDPQFLTHAAPTREPPEAREEAEQPINDFSVLPPADRPQGLGVEEEEPERPSSAAGAGGAGGSRPPSQPGELIPHSQSSSSAPKAAQAQTPEDPIHSALVLPPAVGPGSRDVSRKNSHADASTSYPAPLTGPLPPIHQRVSAHATHSGPTSAGRRGSPGRSSGSWPGSPTSASPSRREPDKRGGGNNPQQSSYYSSRTRPANKPQPRARHDTTAVDPLFLQTAAYRVVPNVGRVYDWKTQHDINAELSKQRKQEAQMQKVLEAARVQLQVRDANERAFQQWLATKEAEKAAQQQQARRIAYVTSVYRSLLKEDPMERRQREAMWVNSFGNGGSEGGRAGRGEPDNGDKFRL